ncbi:NHS-like protein 1 [Bagarius yarrelli]|uniref:NHS-like protein 1 n=1 Tax=Bagarius yarrelli TaxID=175774 RepID=A0A556TT09_BAGYA|nr:NHS-like protein 1 [Bagarius yarrelli]
MRKEKHTGGSHKMRDKKEKGATVTRALSWLSGSSLSRQTRKLFRSHNDLNTLSTRSEHGDQSKDDDDWVYEPQHYIETSQATQCQKMGNAQPLPQCQVPKVGSICNPQPEGNFHRRMLTSRVHQRRESLWTIKPSLRVEDRGEQELPLRPVSNLDEESKWTVHYTAPWHQQENVFLPASRPACVEELHRQAKVNLKTALRDCDKLRKDGFRSSQYYSQGPTFSGSAHSCSSQLEDKDEDLDYDDDDDKSTNSSPEEDKSSSTMRAHTALKAERAEVDGQESCFTPLPTPEEKMRQQAQAILTDIVPINVSGETFDRQASIRRSLINTDTLARRPKKVKRRKTISGLPDNIQQELAKGRGGELRPQSMFIPGQFSTLERSGSMSSTLRHSEKKDSGCQTEEVKIVPPSMRRIRAQRGQGIAAQMAGMSTSATNVSTVQNEHSQGSPVHVMPPRLSSNHQRFHSLPRGARISLNAEFLNSSTLCRTEDITVPVSRQIGKLQADETAIHMRSPPRTSTSIRPKSQEVRGSHADWGTACVVSPHAAYSTSMIPNATVSCSAEIIALHSMSSPGHQLHARISSGVHGESSTSVATSAETGETDMQDGGQSNSSLNSQSTIAAGTESSDEHWIYDTPENVLPRKPLTSSCSTPINHLYNSLERSSKGTDSSSLYSMDNDGYYTSMHLDSGLRPKGRSIAGRVARHSMYECISHPGDRSSIYSDLSLSRSISLRKSKKPPLPPARTDSLKHKPKNKNGVNGSSVSILNESLIATLQQSLQNGLKGKGSLTSPSQSPCSDYEDPWMLRPRSHSSLSAGSSSVSAAGVANVYSICHVTPSHSDTSSLRSDYAESWGYYMDYSRLHSDQAPSPAHSNSLSNGGQPGSMTDGQHIHNDIQSDMPPADENMSSKPQVNTSSPDRVHRLTSPSSGYSSQSNTPTAGTPVPSFIRSMSPSGCKPRPRVPERKSSLLSSVSISSSSTSLSSNTSDSVRNNVPPLPSLLPQSSVSLSPLNPEPFPPPFPPCNPECTQSQTVPPPPAPPLPSTPQHAVSLSPLSINSSPEFPPPPPPEVLNEHSMLHNGPFNPNCEPPLPPPPPAFPPTVNTHIPPPPPALPTLTPIIPSSASIKGIKNRLKSVNSEKRKSVSVPSEEFGKSAMPLITPFALQSVQLRSVKQPENRDNSDKSQKVETKQISFLSEENKTFKHLEHNTVDSCSSAKINETLKENTITKAKSPAEIPLYGTNSEEKTPCDATNNISSDSTGHTLTKAETDGMEKNESPSQNTTPTKIPPMISKKPIFSPVSVAKPEFNVERNKTVDINKDSHSQMFVNAQKEMPICAPNTEVQKSLEEVEKNEYKCSTESYTSEISTFTNDDQIEEPSQTFISQESSTAVETVGTSEEEEEDNEDDDEDELDSSAGSVSSKDDGDVFDSNASNSPQTPSINRDISEDMVTPTRPRTTEDLFAAIHRSKRKVLGRKESDDERLKGHSSPPVTPTGPPASLNSTLARQTGSIQRSLRKSATSSDTFKALLLKKGSRSEGSFRMSAAEMLRTTDPRFHRTRSLDSSLDPMSPTAGLDSPCSSPGRCKRVPDDSLRNESILPRYSLCSPLSPSSMLGPKHSRSRTPPSAASSRYNSRSRILSSPMTVICEREGELTESVEGLDEQCPVSPLVSSTPITQDSNGTLCEGES